MGLCFSVGSGGNFGMADELDDEFFSDSSGIGVGMIALGLPDPEFWNEGYALQVASLLELSNHPRFSSADR